jgi:UDP-3-O-[3-hydroxymyristoyl] glucosamine N-acyltransferase
VTLAALATALGCHLDGDGAVLIRGVATLDQAGPGDLTFLTNPRYAHLLASTRASAALVGADVTDAPCALLRCDEPYVALARALALLAPPERPASGVHPTAVVAADASVDASASIGPYAVVDSRARIGARVVLGPHVVVGAGTTIGDDSWLHAHVSVREGCRLGARCVVQNGAVIGSDGFGFATSRDGVHVKIPQRGPVVIEDDVEIGAQTAIDRPAVGETRICAGTKIDNLVQIAHGVVVGRGSLLAAQVGIAGSTRLGAYVMLGGQVGVSGHLTLGDRVKASAQTGITNSLNTDAFVSGYPAIGNLEWRKSSVLVRRLPELRERVRQLERRLDAIAPAAPSDPSDPHEHSRT